MLKIISYIIVTITCIACLTVAIILRKQEQNGIKRSIKFFMGGIIYSLIFFPIITFRKVDGLTVALLVMPLLAYLTSILSLAGKGKKRKKMKRKCYKKFFLNYRAEEKWLNEMLKKGLKFEEKHFSKYSFSAVDEQCEGEIIVYPYNDLYKDSKKIIAECGVKEIYMKRYFYLLGSAEEFYRSDTVKKTIAENLERQKCVLLLSAITIILSLAATSQFGTSFFRSLMICVGSVGFLTGLKACVTYKKLMNYQEKHVHLNDQKK